MRINLLPTIFTLIACSGTLMFGYSISKQTAIQIQMNDTMHQIDSSLVITGGLVTETSGALSPLAATANALQGVERHEESTVTNLQSMNNHLRTIAETEQNIIQSLDALNASTTGVTQNLSAMQHLNSEIRLANQLSMNQGNTEAGQIGDLNSQTETTISQLQHLNGKFTTLRALP